MLLQMLKLARLVRYNKRDRNHFLQLKRRFGGQFVVDAWNNQMEETKRIKNKISLMLLYGQRLRCVYCEKSLIGIDKEIDHIAPKHLNPEFSFEALNLAYACGYCNGTSKKGGKPTANEAQPFYNQIQFLIVHPYLDDPEEHIVYQDDDRIYLDIERCTDKGRETINMFKFNEDEMITFRAKTLKLERDNPINDETLSRLVKETASYKKHND